MPPTCVHPDGSVREQGTDCVTDNLLRRNPGNIIDYSKLQLYFYYPQTLPFFSLSLCSLLKRHVISLSCCTCSMQPICEQGLELQPKEQNGRHLNNFHLNRAQSVLSSDTPTHQILLDDQVCDYTDSGSTFSAAQSISRYLFMCSQCLISITVWKHRSAVQLQSTARHINKYSVSIQKRVKAAGIPPCAVHLCSIGQKSRTQEKRGVVKKKRRDAFKPPRPQTHHVDDTRTNRCETQCPMTRILALLSLGWTSPKLNVCNNATCITAESSIKFPA